MKRKILALTFLAVIFLLIQACAREVEVEDPCNFVMNSRGQRVSWRHELPVKLYVHSSVPARFHQAIESAVREWNKRGELFVIESWYTTGPMSPRRDGYSMIYLMNSWESDKRSEQARTTIHWSGSQIYEADIRLNGQDYSFYTGNADDNFSGIDLQSLMVHELGHVLGLAHNNRQGSVMNVTLRSGTERREVKTHDSSSLSCEY